MVRIFGLNIAQFGGQQIRDYFYNLIGNAPHRFTLLYRGFICSDHTKIYFTNNGEIVASAEAKACTTNQGYIELYPSSIAVHHDIWISDIINAQVHVIPGNIPSNARIIAPVDALNRSYILPSDDYKIQSLLNGTQTMLVYRIPPLNPAVAKTRSLRPPEKVSSTSNRYRTDIELKATAIARHSCEIDINHNSFPVLDSNGQPVSYMEAHHIIPMSKQHLFDRLSNDFNNRWNINLNLDNIDNIASLCPNCHKAIHLAMTQEKQRLLSILFSNRSAALGQMLPSLTLQELNNFYS